MTATSAISTDLRIAENRLGESWCLIRQELSKVTVGRLETDLAAVFSVQHLKASDFLRPAGLVGRLLKDQPGIPPGGGKHTELHASNP